MKLGRSVLSALRGTREVCDQVSGGKCIGSPGPRTYLQNVELTQRSLQHCPVQHVCCNWCHNGLIGYQGNVSLVSCNVEGNQISEE